METIVIEVDNKHNAAKILEAVTLFKGVKHASKANFEALENISILKACKAARKTPKVTEYELLKALK